MFSSRLCYTWRAVHTHVHMHHTYMQEQKDQKRKGKKVQTFQLKKGEEVSMCLKFSSFLHFKQQEQGLQLSLYIDSSLLFGWTELVCL